MAEEEKEHPATARQRERFAERGERVQVKELSHVQGAQKLQGSLPAGYAA